MRGPLPTRFPAELGKRLRKLLKSSDQGTVAHTPNRYSNDFAATKRGNARDLIRCPKCGDKVREDRLDRHIRRIHNHISAQSVQTIQPGERRKKGKALTRREPAIDRRKKVLEEYEQYRDTYRS